MTYFYKVTFFANWAEYKAEAFFFFCLHTQLSVQRKSLLKLAIWASCGQNVRSSALNNFYTQSSKRILFLVSEQKYGMKCL